MSTRKYKKSSKKKSTTDYWGDDTEPQYTDEQRKRIASYLKENDENCKESTTLILIIVIGLFVAMSIVGFLAIRNNSSVKYKGSHTTYEHTSSNTSILNAVWSKWNWLQGLYFGLNLNSSNATTNAIYSGDAKEMQAIVAIEEELNDFQPIYRNPLLQKLYAMNDEQCNQISEDSLYNFISIKHGSWIPSTQYLEEALDFSWTDFESQQEKEEIELVTNMDKEDETEKDKKDREQLEKQIKSDRETRKNIRPHENNQKGRRLLAKNKKFDLVHALPNPANILLPQKRGDKKGEFSTDQMHAGNKKYLKHLDEVQHKNSGRMRKTPQDILKSIDLSKFGISKAINDETSDKEKREDLAKLETKEASRHPYMTLLTNAGSMKEAQCIANDYRKHEVLFSTDIQDSNDHRDIYKYENNILMWYCYLVEVEAEAMNHLNGGSFKVNLSFSDVNMEVGYDYVDIYINSILTDSVSGIGRNWEENDANPQFVYYINSDYVEQNGASLEVCMKIVTDASVIKKGGGFISQFAVNYDDPQVTKWTKWTPCTTVKPWHNKASKNERYWDGDCGIGVHEKSVTECANANITDIAACNLGERIVEYCVKANCYDFPLVIDPKKFKDPGFAVKFNGFGRVDPDFADPFLVQRSLRDSFDINEIISELSLVRDEIIARYPDEKILGSAVINHYYMDESKLRLGIRLARSLLLGDTFTVYTTGSSNTAGHQNMFIATYPQQLQSMMRPVWKRVGYKGAAFRVRNHAEGGALSTSQLGPCIPSLIGDDADVVFWESQMNDHGDAVSHAIENHFRNAISLPRRPMYHVIHAGKQGPSHVNTFDKQYADKDKKKGQFKNENLAYSWLVGSGKHVNNAGDCDDCLLTRKYTEFGSGAVQFYPTNGLASVNITKYPELRTGYLYVSWHPGPTGHRVYAEMLAYFYLTSVLETLEDIKDLILDLSTNKPIEAMLEILEDPPRRKEMAHDHVANQCDPVCTNATEAVCISGYETLGKPRFSLKRWREKDVHENDTREWKYNSWMRNVQPFINKDGGQGSCDTKNCWEMYFKQCDTKDCWQTKVKDSNKIKFRFKAQQYGYVNIEGDKMNDAYSTQIIINEIDMKSGEISDNPQYEKHAQIVKCGYGATIKDNWAANSNGCHIGGLKPYQKYEIIINVVAQFGERHRIKNIRIY